MQLRYLLMNIAVASAVTLTAHTIIDTNLVLEKTHRLANDTATQSALKVTPELRKAPTCTTSEHKKQARNAVKEMKLHLAELKRPRNHSKANRIEVALLENNIEDLELNLTA